MSVISGVLPRVSAKKFSGPVGGVHRFENPFCVRLFAISS